MTGLKHRLIIAIRSSLARSGGCPRILPAPTAITPPIRNSRRIIESPRLSSGHCLIRQSEHIECIIGANGHVLPAFDLIRNRAARHRSPEIGFPEKFPGAGVQREEVAFSSSREEQVRCSRQNPTLRIVDHFEIPFLVAGQGIDGAHRAVSLLLSSIGGGWPTSAAS